MNREILFRGKRVDNGEWVYGYYANCGRPHGKTNYTYHFIIEYPGTPKDYHEVYTTTIGQYTGLKDRNGVKIFEGDIVRLVHDWHDGTLEKWVAVVEFGNPNGTYSWGWQLKPITECNFNPDILLWVDTEETGASCEVIGNVWDSPELQEQEELLK